MPIRPFTIFLLFVGFFSLTTATLSWAGQTGPVYIVTKDETLKFNVEYAITPEEKAKGLMFRKSLPKRGGMLFIYQKPRQITMWMKNTPLSLDMIFINRRGVIRYIEEKTQPNSTRQIHSGGKVSAVLEVAAGTVENLGIRVGDQVKLPN